MLCCIFVSVPTDPCLLMMASGVMPRKPHIGLAYQHVYILLVIDVTFVPYLLSLLARLAVINMLHEARGLDVFPSTLKKFRNNRDEKSTRVLENNFAEEIFHVATGIKWFQYLCNNRALYNSQIETEFIDECDGGTDSCIQTFHAIVRKFHTGLMKRDTLNIEARTMAGMTSEWLDPIFV